MAELQAEFIIINKVIKMKSFNKFLVAGFLSVTAVTVQAGVQALDFEDLTTDYDIPLASGYGGFNWDGGIGDVYAQSTADSPSSSGYANASTSGEMHVYNGTTTTGIITPISIDWAGTGNIDFISAYFTSAWSSSQTLSFEGWSDGAQVYKSSEYIINDSSPTLVSLNWTDIDSLVIHNYENADSDNTRLNWAMYDFTFNNPLVSTVPEPATYALMLSGLGLVGFMARRREKQHA